MESACTYSSKAPWLQSLLQENQGPPPRLYAWSLANILDDAGSSSRDARDGAIDLDRRIYVFGVGNLGRLYATSLREHPQRPPVTLVIHRKELLSQWLESDGIQITRGGVARARKDFDMEWWTEEPPTRGPVREAAHGQQARNLIIATKTSAVIPQLDRLRRYLDRGSTVAFLQNGMCPLWPPSGDEYVSRRFDPDQAPNFMACINNHGVYSVGPFSSVHASLADTAVGPVLLNGRTDGLAPSVGHLSQLLCTAPHFNARAVTGTDLWVRQLVKLVVNSTINSLTAVLRCKNGDVLSDQNRPVLHEVIETMLAEMSQVLQALIYSKSVDRLLDPALQPALQTHQVVAEQKTLSSVRGDLATRFSLPQLRASVFRVWETVRENYSSTLQDVRAGKATEIRDFNGWFGRTASFLEQEVQEDGRSLCLDVSVNKRLVDLVEAQAVMSASELASHLLTSHSSTV